MKRIVLSMFALFLLLATSARGAEKYDPAALAKTIGPYIDEAALFVVHVDMTRADIAPVAAKIKGLLPKFGSQQQQADALANFDQGIAIGAKWISDFTRAGGRDYFAVVSMSGFPQAPLYAVVPLKPGADAQTIIKLLAVDDAQNSGITAEVRGDVILLGRKATLDSLKTLKPRDHPELAKAFEAAGDSAAQALFVPSADTRKVLAEMMPDPSAGPLQGVRDPVTKGLLWMAFGLEISPDLSLNVVMQSPDGPSAAALAQTLNKLIGMGKQMLAQELGGAPEIARFVGDLDALAKAFTPTVAGDRLMLHLDADQSLKLAGIIFPAIAKARGQSMQTVSMNNIKQILMACEIYAEKHKGEFPADFQALLKADNIIGPMLFKHPQMPDKEIGYTYLRPSRTSPAEQVVVYEAWEKMPARLVVGFADGHVELMDVKRFQEALNQSKARLEEK